MEYKIESFLNDVPNKTVIMVSFNGRPAERYEVESLDPTQVHNVLVEVNQQVVEADSAPTPEPPQLDENGHIVIPEVQPE